MNSCGWAGDAVNRGVGTMSIVGQVQGTKKGHGGRQTKEKTKQDEGHEKGKRKGERKEQRNGAWHTTRARVVTARP